MIRFETPEAIILLPAVLALALLLATTFQWKARVLRMFAEEPILAALTAAVSRPRQLLKAGLTLIALLAIVGGLAQPHLGEEIKPQPPQRADVMVVVDVSLSMAAEDLKPSRLEHAKQQVLTLIDRLQGDRIGVIIFAGASALRVPLTLDYDAAKAVVRTIQPDSAPVPGSAVAEGVGTALRSLRTSTASTRTVLLITDGEDLGSEIPAAIAEANAQEIAVHAVGVGTPQGSPIPVRQFRGSTSRLKRDSSGQVVITRLDEQSLQQLASATAGSYRRALGPGRELGDTYDRVVYRPNLDPFQNAGAAPNDLSPYLILVAFLALLVELLLPERRSMGRASHQASPKAAALAVIAVGLLTGACTGVPDPAFEANTAGIDRFTRGYFDDALDSFREAQVERPELPELNLNTGATLYELKSYDRSQRETQEALSPEPSELRARAHYNMGNIFFQTDALEDAFESYKKALRDNPDDMDAKVNLELTLRQLQAQQQQQAQQQAQEQGEGEPGEQDPNQQQPPDQQPQPGEGTPPQQPQQSGNPPPAGNQSGGQGDPDEELRRSMREAGADISIDEAMRILDALRERELRFQERYNRTTPGDGRTQRPEKDW